MSTKNLARTVIEGGRHHGNTLERRSSHRAVRAGERNSLKVVRDAADAEHLSVPRLKYVHRGFNDKLAPSERWLARQVGRPWSLVRSELFARFDTRTTPGRHILFCHMLPSVAQPGQVRAWRTDFVVDRHGLLRAVPFQRPRARHARLPRPECELLRWLDRRRVGARGEALFWFVLTPKGGYRQHLALGEEDAALWRSLPRWFQEHHDPSAPPPDPRTWS